MITEEVKEPYLPISPHLIFPERLGNFEVYVRRGSNYVLFTKERERFDERIKTKLYDLGVEEVFIKGSQKKAFDQYVRVNLGQILENESIPMEDRAEILHDVSTHMISEFFTNKLPEKVKQRFFKDIMRMVTDCVNFFNNEEALAKLGQLIAHNYDVFTHNVDVFVLTMAVLNTFDLDHKTITNAGIGALLHDVGKLSIHKKILDKNGLTTDPVEIKLLQQHTVYGTALCANLPLDGLSMSCILLHHEHEDGSGYPSGISGDHIPFSIKVLSACNTYLQLTTPTPSKNALTPYKALQFMSKSMEGAFDPVVLKHLVMVLSGANIL
ncbi:HD-GYP domain-containing protein [Desulfovibrio inopinatus]|uniref:HD-GYP domain-containing protein n=1 Tax=Desulfovibrio inopinatus TaxID=102109 RepID=UPI0003FE3A63|nr:HD domain-containing phosphohydrolase [Desulfovibrio inopinatus]